MCGIVGYVGQRTAAEYLLQGLRRLEYRGYDSAGLATLDDAGQWHVTKTAGRIDDLAACLNTRPTPGQIGIGHTRWATHGPPTDANAHPHLGGSTDAEGSVVAVVHNGVIENWRKLKDRLLDEGYEFLSETDTEVIAHLLASCLADVRGQGAGVGGRGGEGLGAGGWELGTDVRAQVTDLDEPEDLRHANREGHDRERHEYDVPIRAVQSALAQLRGTYGLAILFRDYPDVVFAARLGSPLVVGVGQGEHFLASDGSPLVGYTNQIVYLADHELAIITADSLRVIHRDQGHVEPRVDVLEIDAADVELGGFPHYMLKEIFEQPESLQNAMRGRLSHEDATAVFGGLTNLSPQQLRAVDRILLTACGTSFHAGMVGEYLIEEFARIPVEVEYASELRYRNPPMDKNTLVFAITQSGETADTLAAMREMKRQGHPTLAICNVVGSSIAKEAACGVYLHAGAEIGVASTKAFTSQCLVLALLALYFGRMRHISYVAGRRIIKQLEQLPDQVSKALDCNSAVRQIAAKYCHCQNFLYLGRHYNYPTALEGALKLKEISYIHAEGYPAAEMKHGPIALVDHHTPALFLVPQGFVYDKVMSNLMEIKARGGPVIAVVCEGDTRVAEVADDVIYVPAVEEFLQPIVTVIPLQLLAYHIAVLRGCDVDKPRNLAKSVTVE